MTPGQAGFSAFCAYAAARSGRRLLGAEASCASDFRFCFCIWSHSCFQEGDRAWVGFRYGDEEELQYQIVIKETKEKCDQTLLHCHITA